MKGRHRQVLASEDGNADTLQQPYTLPSRDWLWYLIVSVKKSDRLLYQVERDVFGQPAQLCFLHGTAVSSVTDHLGSFGLFKPLKTPIGTCESPKYQTSTVPFAQFLQWAENCDDSPTKFTSSDGQLQGLRAEAMAFGAIGCISRGQVLEWIYSVS